MEAQDLTAANVAGDVQRHIAWTIELLKADQETETWDGWSDAGAAIHARVEALPNTPENLAVRALAITGMVSDSADPDRIDLGELSAHAESTAGRLMKQVLSCILGREGCAMGDSSPITDPD